MHLSTVILPIYRWAAEGLKMWQRAEELGFHAAYTYDHLSWRVPFREGPWFGAVPTLTAAATVTQSMRLGTLVTSLNFRHPVTLAKDLITLDDVSDGRITLGIGAAWQRLRRHDTAPERRGAVDTARTGRPLRRVRTAARPAAA